MCGGGGSTPKATTPAPAPAPPDPVAVEQDPTSRRREEDRNLFGTLMPTLRVDRSATAGGAVAGGAGLKM